MFFPLTSPCTSSRSDQWPPKGFWFWSSSNAIATPWCFASILGSHGGWFWSGDYMVWPILTVATSHRPHLCESEHVFFLIRFFIQNTPLEWLQASWCQPNLWLKDGLHGAPLVINMVFWPGDCHKMLQEPLRLNEEETYNKVKNNWQHEAQGRQFYICINIYFK